DGRTQSGLVLITKILKDIEEIKFIYLTENDVIRHKLVKKIIKAYEQWEEAKKNV
ncbi:MAG: PhoH family protein, partial [Endomicrobia bacterium]|nr:PhoH family protein [Endomicrobiia bacterium]